MMLNNITKHNKFTLSWYKVDHILRWYTSNTGCDMIFDLIT